MKVLDFNSVEIKTLDIVLRDVERTAVRIKYPTEGLVQELLRLSPVLKAANEKGDEESTALAYDTVARFISCNREGLKVTGEELRGKYRMEFEHIVIFCNNYLEFINDITNAKN